MINEVDKFITASTHVDMLVLRNHDGYGMQRAVAQPLARALRGLLERSRSGRSQ